MDLGTEPAAERAEDVPPHTDGGGHQDHEAREQVQGVADRGEGDAGDEVATRRNQERDETRTDSGDVRA